MEQNLLLNPVFWATISAFIISQFVKPFINLICGNGWDTKLFLSNGGMPSSHTASVVALATSVGIQRGFGSTEFIICAVFSVVVMNDAFNVRLETGKQAEVLNEWAKFFGEIFQNGAFTMSKFKTMVGHTVVQVFWGFVIGIIVGLLATYLFTLYV